MGEGGNNKDNNNNKNERVLNDTQVHQWFLRDSKVFLLVFNILHTIAYAIPVRISLSFSCICLT